jgi:hypothetical protein
LQILIQLDIGKIFPEFVDRSGLQVLLKWDKMAENFHIDLVRAFQQALRESVAKYLGE